MKTGVPAMNKFAAAANKAMGASKAAILKARGETQHFANADCADLVNFGEKLAASDAPADVKAAAAEMAAVRGAWSARRIPRPSWARAAWWPLPHSSSYNKVYDDAGKIAFAKEGWGGFLKNLRK